MSTLLRLAPTEIMKWQKLCQENPSVTAESLLERVAVQAGVAENAGATSAAPRVTPVDDSGKVGEKRENGCTSNTARTRVKVEAEDEVSDAEAKRLVGSMYTLALRLVNKELKGVTKGLPSKRKEWGVYKKDHGGDFSKGSMLSNLQRANGFLPGCFYTDGRIKTALIELDGVLAGRLFKAFPTFQVLRGRMGRLNLSWPAWWQ